MYVSPFYPVPTRAEIDAFVAAQRWGKLIGTGADGYPRVSLLPFVRDGDCIEVHLVRQDATFAALQSDARAAFLVDEPLAFTPHDVLDERDAGFATLHFRAVLFHVRAELATDADSVARALERLLAAYEPDARWEPVRDGLTYGPRLAQLATARLHVVGVEAKFKLAQNRSAEGRQRLLDYLNRRGLAGDPLAVSRIVAANPPDRVHPADGAGRAAPTQEPPAGSPKDT